MNKLTLAQFYLMLQNSTAVIVDGSALTYPEVLSDEDEEGDIFLHLLINDSENHLTFKKSMNESVNADSMNCYLRDNNNNEVRISFLTQLTIRDALLPL